MPSATKPVDLVSATDSSITLAFHESENNGGTEILGYELWMDDGLYQSASSKVDSYSDNSITHTISSGLVTGRIYTFKYRCYNDVGFSDFSIERRYAITAPP